MGNKSKSRRFGEDCENRSLTLVFPVTFDRDSMKTRNSLGYPGSKRHRYWMNGTRAHFLESLEKAWFLVLY